MARIIAPNREYAGVSAGIPFEGGIGHTDNPLLIGWFKDHGYEVEETDEAAPAQVKEKKPRKKRSAGQGE